MAEQVFGLTGPSVRKVRRAVNRLERQPVNLRVNLEGDRARESRADNRIHVRNDSGAIIPAWGVMAETGKEQYGDRVQYVVTKTSTTFHRRYWVNSGIDIPIGGFGVAQNGPQVRVLYDTGTTPATGNGYGPVPGQWYVGQHYPETLLVDGEHDDEETLVGDWHDINRVIAEAAEDIATGASGDGTPQKGVAGSEATAGYDDVTWFNLFTPITSGDKIIGLNISGQWYWCKPGEGVGDLCHINGNELTDIPEGSDITTAKILAIEDGCLVYFTPEECP